MDIVEWIVWAILAILTFIMFITWIFKKRSYQHGHFYDTREIVTLYSVPRVSIAETIVLVAFLFIGVNKLHLLWLYPAIYFLLTFMMARRVSEADKESLNKKRNPPS